MALVIAWRLGLLSYFRYVNQVTCKQRVALIKHTEQEKDARIYNIQYRRIEWYQKPDCKSLIKKS